MAPTLADVRAPFCFRNRCYLPQSQRRYHVYYYQRNPNCLPPFSSRSVRPIKSVEVEEYVISSDEEEEMGEGFLEAIEELERMVRDPSDVLEEMNDRLSARELQLVLVYFSQDGRDSWCALEVFDWLRKENRVDSETMDLMVSIMCSWIRKLIAADCDARDIVDLLVDMECVGLRPNFSMLDKVVSLYWELDKKAAASSFVEDVIRRGVVPGNRSPAGYLVWKMMGDGRYGDAVELVVHLKESGLKVDKQCYVIAMSSVVKELNELSKALRKLKGYSRKGMVAELDDENAGRVDTYQREMIGCGVRLGIWAMEEGGRNVEGLVRERLLAMYICGGRGAEAERELMELRRMGRPVDDGLEDVVLAICASQKERGSVRRLLGTVVASRTKNAYTWLLRGYVKGGHYNEAAEALVEMLNKGVYPDYLDRVAVVQGLSKRVDTRNSALYINLCRTLCNAGLIAPPLLSLHLRAHKIWILQMM